MITGHIWLCVERTWSGNAVRVSGDTGQGGLDEPYRSEGCWYYGPTRHGSNCGWYKIEPERPKRWRVMDLRYRSRTRTETTPDT